MSAGDWKDLFLAACDGDAELVGFHLRNGVDPNHSHPEFQSTPLVASILAGQEAVAHLLLDHGADPLLHSEFDELTPVDAARRAGMPELEARLRALGASRPNAALTNPRRTRGWFRARTRSTESP